MMHAAPLELSRSEKLSEAAVMGRAREESFPVAARVLPREDRRHLLALYGFARLADELGDELDGDRLAALDWLAGELDNAYRGVARHPLMRTLQATLAERSLPREPFMRLIDANRIDQHMSSYETWEQLRSYCRLSANPVGELVLCVFGLSMPERIALSDRVCTALQLAEHLQDLGEDVTRGRMYIPAEDLARFGCSHEQLAMLVSHAGMGLDLGGVPAGSPAPGEDFRRSAEQLREAISFEVTRARELLACGVDLVAGVPGRPKLAVAAFVAGGRAALDAIERARFEVLGGTRRVSLARRLRALVSVLAESLR
jgi:squalene synthase HpnC